MICCGDRYPVQTVRDGPEQIVSLKSEVDADFRTARKKRGARNSPPFPTAYVYELLSRREDVVQIHHRNSGRHVEAGLTLYAHGLQRDRAVHSTNQHVGASADTSRRTGSGTRVMARKRTR